MFQRHLKNSFIYKNVTIRRNFNLILRNLNDEFAAERRSSFSFWAALSRVSFELFFDGLDSQNFSTAKNPIEAVVSDVAEVEASAVEAALKGSNKVWASVTTNDTDTVISAVLSTDITEFQSRMNFAFQNTGNNGIALQNVTLLEFRANTGKHHSSCKRLFHKVHFLQFDNVTDFQNCV